jgi:hypothetical protein
VEHGEAHRGRAWDDLLPLDSRPDAASQGDGIELDRVEPVGLEEDDVLQRLDWARVVAGALRRDPKAVCIVGSPPQAEEAERYERVVASLETEVGVDEALTRGAALTQADAAALVRSVIESARG